MCVQAVVRRREDARERFRACKEGCEWRRSCGHCRPEEGH